MDIESLKLFETNLENNFEETKFANNNNNANNINESMNFNENADNISK